MAYFIPFSSEGKSTYEKGVSLFDLFPTNVTGIVTGKDKAAIAPSRAELEKRLEIVRNSTDDNSILNLWGKFGRGQTAERIQNDVLSGGNLTPISFRPFDERWTYYSGTSCGWILWPREKATMGHLLAMPTSPIGENIGIVFCKPSGLYSVPFVTKHIADNRLFSASCERAYIAPLYLRSESELTGENWSANIDIDSFNTLTKYLHKTPTPIELFDYVYGILHDPAYYEKYEEFLRRDFPRVPIINEPEEKRNQDSFYVSEELYREYVTVGEQLRKLHLMEITFPAEIAFEPSMPDDIKISLVKYNNGVLHINANTSITGISQDVWNYQIGGYKVLDKWLKEHKGEELTIDSFTHISNVVGLLSETINLREHLRSLHD